MLTPLNRAQLAAVFQQDRCQEIVRILDQHNIPSQVRTMDRTSPSVFSMGTRERSGALFQDPAQSWQYVIYVARKDLETARALTGLDGIRSRDRKDLIHHTRSVQRAPGNGCSWGPFVVYYSRKTGRCRPGPIPPAPGPFRAGKRETPCPTTKNSSPTSSSGGRST